MKPINSGDTKQTSPLSERVPTPQNAQRVPSTTSTKPLGLDGIDASPAPWSVAPGPTDAPPTDIKALVEYRRKRREYRALGLTVPKADLGRLPGNPAVPELVEKIFRSIDRELPELMKEKNLTLDRLFEMSGVTHARGATTPWQKTRVGAGIFCAGVAAYHLAQHVVGLPDVAVLLGSAFAGHKLAGALTHLAHDLFDEYDFFPEAFEFQVHHEDPQELGKWGAANTVYNTGKVMVPALGLLAALDPSLGIGSAAAAFVLTGWLAPLFHKWTHRTLNESSGRLEKFQQKLINFAQEVGLIVSKRAHATHHAGSSEGRMHGEPRLTHTSHFDVGSGSFGLDVNEIFNKWSLSQRLKRAVYLATELVRGEGNGLKPNSWIEHPELEILWGGRGTEAERKAACRAYRARQQSDRVEHVRQQLEAESNPRRREVLEKHLEKLKESLAIFTDPVAAKAFIDRYETRRQQMSDAPTPEIVAFLTQELEEMKSQLPIAFVTLEATRGDARVSPRPEPPET